MIGKNSEPNGSEFLLYSYLAFIETMELNAEFAALVRAEMALTL